ncbi:ABC transporter ATP-binding protein [Brevibacterium litoralis]|uniref:ABC transporter ATP-binding protein n=1 Tax=Brevibacterium litoralis TaxID=3138935 RepID=UPI0032F07B77
MTGAHDAQGAVRADDVGGTAGVTRGDHARWLLSRTRGLVWPLVVSVLARVVGQLLGVAMFVLAGLALVRAVFPGVFPVAFGPVDAYVPWVPEAVGGLVVALVVLALLKAGLRYLEHYAGHWVAFTSLQRLREIYVRALVPQAPAATRGKAGAELTERGTRDIDRIEVFFAHTLPPAVSAVLVPLVVLLWAGFAVDPGIALVLAPFVLVVTVLLPLLSARTTWRSARLVSGRRGLIAAHLGDDVQGVREVLAFEAQAARLHGLDAEDASLERARTRAGIVQGVRAAATQFVQLSALVAVLVYASTRLTPEFVLAHAGQAGLSGDAVAGPVSGELAVIVQTVTAVVVGLMVCVGLWGAAKGVDDFASGLDQSFAATARVREVVEAEPLVEDRVEGSAGDGGGVGVGGETGAGGESGAVPEASGPAAVEFRGVTFTYPGAPEPVVADVDVHVPADTWGCLVGVSGSGKSTLGDLLLRGWDVDSGAVLLDGADVRSRSLDDLRSQVALVPQKPTMITGALAENLRLGAPDADESDLWRALEVVGMAEWARGLDAGLATPVTGRGLGVSGGQLQRLALARALVADPRVLVLDEALSQLDSATAGQVRARLAAHVRGRTTVVEITHRVDLVPDEARVHVLDRGRVVESGRAGDLRPDGDGAFSRLEARV